MYKIGRPRGNKTQWVHFDRLKPYVGGDLHGQKDAADNHCPAAHQTSRRDANPQSATTSQMPGFQPIIADDLLDDEDEQPTKNDDQDEDVPAQDPALAPAPRRYPARDSRIPDRYGLHLQH